MLQKHILSYVLLSPSVITPSFFISFHGGGIDLKVKSRYELKAPSVTTPMGKYLNYVPSVTKPMGRNSLPQGEGAAMHGLRRRHQVMKPDQGKVLCFKVASFGLPISQWALGLDSFSPSEEVTASEGASHEISSASHALRNLWAIKLNLLSMLYFSLPPKQR
jgi:hypothetical protein